MAHWIPAPAFAHPVRRLRLLALAAVVAVELGAVAAVSAQAVSPATAVPPPVATTPVSPAAAIRLAARDVIQLVDSQGNAVGLVRIGYEILDALLIERTLYVACGAEGVLAFDVSDPAQPRLQSRLGGGRNAVKLAQSGRTLLIIVAEYGALAYSIENPQRPVAVQLGAGLASGLSGEAVGPSAAPLQGGLALPTRPSAAVSLYEREAPRVRSAKVTQVTRGWVVITADGELRVGDRFVIRSQRLVRALDPLTGQRVRRPTNEPMGMLVIDRVTSSGGAGPLIKGTVARVGDVAEPTTQPLYEPKVAPRLWYGMTRIVANLRPFIGIAPLGFGMINDFAVEYYTPVPIKIGAEIMPLGFTTSGGVGVVSEFRFRFAFASSYFEAGLAPGARVYRLGGSLFSLSYSLRLGSLDGLNLIFWNSFTLSRSGGSNRTLEFSSAGGEINIPVARKFTINLTGAGAEEWVFGTVGLKYYMRGAGGPGTVILSSGFGGTMVTDRCIFSSGFTDSFLCDSSMRPSGIGPLITVGVDARL